MVLYLVPLFVYVIWCNKLLLLYSRSLLFLKLPLSFKGCR